MCPNTLLRNEKKEKVPRFQRPKDCQYQKGKVAKKVNLCKKVRTGRDTKAINIPSQVRVERVKLTQEKRKRSNFQKAQKTLLDLKQR